MHGGFDHDFPASPNRSKSLSIRSSLREEAMVHFKTEDKANESIMREEPLELRLWLRQNNERKEENVKGTDIDRSVGGFVCCRLKRASVRDLLLLDINKRA